MALELFQLSGTVRSAPQVLFQKIFTAPRLIERIRQQIFDKNGLNPGVFKNVQIGVVLLSCPDEIRDIIKKQALHDIGRQILQLTRRLMQEHRTQFTNFRIDVQL